MAINSLFDKVKSGTDTALNVIREKAGQMNANSPETSLLEAKREIKSLVDKKAKLYSYIGMEIYDLHNAGQIDIPQTKEFCMQMDDLSKKIKELETEVERMQAANQRNNICECGCKLGKNSKFCPSCGKPAQPDMIACTCGNLVSKNAMFCEKCGAKTQELLAAQSSASMQKINCVCGALIDIGQPICMECGRRAPQNT